MSYTLYTDTVSTRYKELADNVREKIIALNEFTNINEYVSKIAEKYYNLVVLYDKIANNRLSDIDYNDALDNVKTAMNEVNIAQNSYIRDLYVELNGNLSLEP